MQDNWIPWQLPASAERDAIFVSGSCNCSTDTRELLVDQSCSNQKLMDGYFYWSEWEDSENRIEMHRILKLDWHVLDIQVNIVTFNQPGYIKEQDNPRRKTQRAAQAIPGSSHGASCCKDWFPKSSSARHVGLPATGNNYSPAKQISVNYILPYA